MERLWHDGITNIVLSILTGKESGFTVAVLISRSIEARLLSEPRERGAAARDISSPDLRVHSPYIAIRSRKILCSVARVVKLADPNW
jgi:hypothetical protein